MAGGLVISRTALRRQREEGMKQTTALVVVFAAAAAAEDEHRRAICRPPRVRRRFESAKIRKVRPTVDYVFGNFLMLNFLAVCVLIERHFLSWCRFYCPL
jgi:hypothetical protein